MILGACAAAAIIAAAGITAALASSTHNAPHHHQATAAVLTDTDGITICNDLNGWIETAINQDQPRLDWGQIIPAGVNMTALNASQLGQDLASEASDLEENNSLALETGTIYNEQGVSNTTALSNDCTAYSVTLNWQPGGQ